MLAAPWIMLGMAAMSVPPTSPADRPTLRRSRPSSLVADGSNGLVKQQRNVQPDFLEATPGTPHGYSMGYSIGKP